MFGGGVKSGISWVLKHPNKLVTEDASVEGVKIHNVVRAFPNIKTAIATNTY